MELSAPYLKEAKHLKLLKINAFYLSGQFIAFKKML